MTDPRVRFAVMVIAAGGALVLAGGLAGSARPVIVVGLVVMTVGVGVLVRQTTVALDAAASHAERVNAAGQSVDLARLQEATLESLDIGLAVYRGAEVVFANQAATTVLGSGYALLSTLQPPPIRAMVERHTAAAPAEPVQFEVGLPARLMEAAVHTLDAETIAVSITDVTDRARADAVRRDFVAAASHELKTPVASIQAASETLLGAQDDPEAVGEFTDRIHATAVRLGRLVDDLLDLSRLEFGIGEVAVFDVGEAAAAELALISTDSHVVESAVEAAVIEGRESDVRLAIRNLLDNAIRHTEAGGTVRLAVTPQASHVRIEVSDTGIGIRSTALPRVFERFYRADEARSRERGGTGLGLAIVKHVAEQHGGSVEASSELGVGSRFVMELPM